MSASFFLSLLLLMTICSFLSASFQILCHSCLTIICLFVEKASVFDNNLLCLISFLIIVCSIIFSFIIRKHFIERSLKELVFSLIFIIIIVYSLSDALPISIQKFNYTISFSIILIGLIYNLLGCSIINQLVGMVLSLNGLYLIAGLWENDKILIATFCLYILTLGSFLFISIKTGRFLRVIDE